jgi:hypothetical protein
MNVVAKTGQIRKQRKVGNIWMTFSYW